jgi:hypothetical protein
MHAIVHKTDMLNFGTFPHDYGKLGTDFGAMEQSTMRRLTLT